MGLGKHHTFLGQEFSRSSTQFVGIAQLRDGCREG